jgi:tetratricopeptide (TPR) repeat protein
MSAKRNRKSRGAESRGVRRASHTVKSLGREWRAVWIILLVILMVGTGAFFLLPGGTPHLPEISTAQLDPSSASLIQQHVEAVRLAPRSGASWGKLGGILKSLEFREQALRCFEVAAKFDSTEPRWPYLHGAMLAAESPHESVTLLRRAVRLCGNEPDAPRMRLAKLLAETGQWDEARLELQALVRAKPDHAPALLALAGAAQARGDFVEALSFANRCTQDRRTARAAWTLVAVLHQRLGETNLARTAIEKAGTVSPDAAIPDPFEVETAEARGDPRDLSDRAQRLLQSGRLAEAGPLVTRLVKDHPDFPESWLLLGRWQLLSKEPAHAEQSIRRHLELDRTSVNGVFQLGMALLAQNRFGDAETSFRRATELKADFGPAHFNLGLALARSERKTEALACFREAIRHNPERIDSYVLLADLYWQLGKAGEAAQWLRQAELLDPTDRRLSTLRKKLGAP